MRRALALAAVAGLACTREPREPPAPTPAPDAATRAPAQAVAPAEPAAGVQASPAPAAQATPTTSTGRRIEITVNEAGFSPREVKVKKGEPATLVFTRVTDRTCITAIDIPAENVKQLELPLNEPTAVTITPVNAGVEAFHCNAMAMGNGKIVVEE
jgi:plastocyanin